ncbi:nicotinate-nucleotide--dimethylbenzimidazole phosphoribosyltransferase [Vallitalea maricola]|uniref:Nicotinate-nucleotide--dimethylbenzimidazole phosphoribosyltransferase n=1 Tax=Vallitalea maricola TaxID=3074433 RepID=A0ACB5UCX4_9FIRM|nr:nicotinate-nucleotide--dimethylbenzimidazole phosphoribosyltransferase [Vallitalea sp. AN17-2]
MELKHIIESIDKLDKKALKEAQIRVNNLAKPLGSLGKLEDIAIQIAGITGEINNVIKKKCTIVMSADNGIVEEGVSSTPQNVTAMQTINMLDGLTGISVLSKQSGAEIRVIDIGIKADLEHPRLIHKKVMYGTHNFAKGPAMSREQVIEAISIGIETVKQLLDQGYNLLGTGEMGIGNTSTSSAVLMSLTGCNEDIAVGKGGGLTDEALENKKTVIRKAIDYHKPNPNDPIDVLTKVGGLDIAGLVGCYIGAAYYRLPIVIDGFISAAAALLAYKLNPVVKEYMIPSHYSMEPGYKSMMDTMGLEPCLHMNMRLGEGTGCPLMFNIIESALAMMNNMITFESAEIDTDYLVDIRT